MDWSELRRLARKATYQRIDPQTFLEPRKRIVDWPTQADLEYSGAGVWFGDKDFGYIAAANPQTILSLLDELERRTPGEERDG